MELSIKEFEEHHIWKVIVWFLGSPPCFPSNLGMSDGNLIGIVGKEGSCLMGSLINLDKSGNSKVTKNWSCRLGCAYW